MKRYIEHLIEDLEKVQVESAERLNSFFTVPVSSDYDCMHDEELEGVKLSDLIGLEQFFFPNIDYLSDVEVAEVVMSLIKVYEAYGLNPIFESCVNDRIKYGHLRYALEHQVYPVRNQVVDLEMCDYLPKYCPLYDLCSHHNAHNVCCELKRRA
ncbi:hypothetical protein KDU71_12160 [Carboxylicivirga sediminis]|uniref:Uncharacterized protein n=1 Tax=Carboxylicivirga sediminis TaxID=2006564 RepID=A0A941F3Y7_9BACT|nr:hypothetical protein [Carboxylicivirga sediminis]MBR8536316.1 hypothetical protein [Carboxylicivirga sediminis]